MAVISLGNLDPSALVGFHLNLALTLAVLRWISLLDDFGLSGMMGCCICTARYMIIIAFRDSFPVI
jgi:hypothetical protein